MTLQTRTLPELLAPAGNLEKLETALIYGANAVYLGGPGLNLRAAQAHMGWHNVAEGITKAHAANAKAYLTLNAIPRQRDLPVLRDLLEELAHLEPKPDGLIVADPGVFELAAERLPDIPRHVSTQAGTLNAAAARAWAKRGATRVNLGRELSLQDIRTLAHDAPGLELEAFVHGAQCLAVAGSCLLSAWLVNRSGNLGTCSHPCRYDYRRYSGCHQVEEALRPDQTCWEVEPVPPQGLKHETAAEGFGRMFAPQDLGLIKFLPWFARQGVAALKIEGRMKSTLYAAQVTDVYATALADFAAGTYRPALYLRELALAATRPFGSGFFLPGGPERRRTYHHGRDTIRSPLAAKVLGDLGGERFLIEARGRLHTGDTLELLLPGLRRPVLDGWVLETEAGQPVDILHPGTKGILRNHCPHLRPGIFVRKRAAQA